MQAPIKDSNTSARVQSPRSFSNSPQSAAWRTQPRGTETAALCLLIAFRRSMLCSCRLEPLCLRVLRGRPIGIGGALRSHSFAMFWGKVIDSLALTRRSHSRPSSTPSVWIRASQSMLQSTWLSAEAATPVSAGNLSNGKSRVPHQNRKTKCNSVKNSSSYVLAFVPQCSVIHCRFF